MQDLARSFLSFSTYALNRLFNQHPPLWFYSFHLALTFQLQQMRLDRPCCHRMQTGIDIDIDMLYQHGNSGTGWQGLQCLKDLLFSVQTMGDVLGDFRLRVWN